MHERVMVAVDPRSTGHRAVEEAAVLARSHEAELMILVAYPNRMSVEERRDRDAAPYDHQWRLSPGSRAEAAAQEAVQRARRFAGDISIRTRCEPGKPVPVLAAATKELDADLLVIELTGGRGPSTITPRVANALDRKADCEVVVIADGGDAGRPVWAPAPGIESLLA